MIEITSLIIIDRYINNYERKNYLQLIVNLLN